MLKMRLETPIAAFCELSITFVIPPSYWAHLTELIGLVDYLSQNLKAISGRPPEKSINVNTKTNVMIVKQYSFVLLFEFIGVRLLITTYS